jgi:hypothetical protein
VTRIDNKKDIKRKKDSNNKVKEKKVEIVLISLKVRQSASTLLIPTLPTISIPRSPSPTASALISLASNSFSLVVYLTIITSPLNYMIKLKNKSKKLTLW